MLTSGRATADILHLQHKWHYHLEQYCAKCVIDVHQGHAFRSKFEKLLCLKLHTYRLAVRQIIAVFLLRTKVVECYVVHNFSKYFILFLSFVELLSNLCFFFLLKCVAIILR